MRANIIKGFAFALFILAGADYVDAQPIPGPPPVYIPLNITGDHVFTSTTDSGDPTTGAVVIHGGLGVGLTAWFGGDINVNGTTNFNSVVNFIGTSINFSGSTPIVLQDGTIEVDADDGYIRLANSAPNNHIQLSTLDKYQGSGGDFNDMVLSGTAIVYVCDHSQTLAGGCTQFLTNKVQFTKPEQLPGYLVSALPVGAAGMRAFVTNATACTFNVAVVNGGGIFCPVFYNGTAWVAG